MFTNVPQVKVERKASEPIPQKVFIQSFLTSQFPQKPVNLFFVLVIVKDKLTNLCGNGLLQDDFTNTFCEIRAARTLDAQDRGENPRPATLSPGP